MKKRKIKKTSQKALTKARNDASTAAHQVADGAQQTMTASTRHPVPAVVAVVAVVAALSLARRIVA